MNEYLDFENEQKGYEPFALTKENINANIGKRICYVDRAYVDSHRGTFLPRYGIIYGTKYNRLFLNEMGVDIKFTDVLDCGIEITNK